MMRRYLIQSTVGHFTFFLLLLIYSFLRPTPDIIWLDGSGFGYQGGGGSGDGKPKAQGLKQEKRGQPVPKPIKEVVPDKPAPVQKATKAEETWKVKDPKKEITVPKKRQEPTIPVPVSEETKKSQSNVIRKGTAKDSKLGEGEFDYGDGPGKGLGKGKGVGVGIGDGSGSGSGFGFGGYLSVLRRRIYSEWTQYSTIGNNKSCIVGLTVGRSGQVSAIKLVSSSGDSFYDNVALRAVRNSSPLPPLPPGFPKSEQRFRLEFRLIE